MLAKCAFQSCPLLIVGKSDLTSSLYSHCCVLEHLMYMYRDVPQHHLTHPDIYIYIYIHDIYYVYIILYVYHIYIVYIIYIFVICMIYICHTYVYIYIYIIYMHIYHIHIFKRFAHSAGPN